MFNFISKDLSRASSLLMIQSCYKLRDWGPLKKYLRSGGRGVPNKVYKNVQEEGASSNHMHTPNTTCIHLSKFQTLIIFEAFYINKTCKNYKRKIVLVMKNFHFRFEISRACTKY